MPFDPHIAVVPRAAEDLMQVPEDARLALIAATILRTLSTRPYEHLNYPSPRSMTAMAESLENLADLWDRG